MTKQCVLAVCLVWFGVSLFSAKTIVIGKAMWCIVCGVKKQKNRNRLMQYHGLIVIIIDTISTYTMCVSLIDGSCKF